MIVTIYSAPNCPKCSILKTVCEAYEVKTEVKVLDVDYTPEEFQELMPGIREIPQVFENGIRIGGLEDFKQHLIERNK